jgi:uroporphyrinogen-III synthase
LGVPVTISAPEPNTWREIVSAFDESSHKVHLKGKRIAVQEHGQASTDLHAALHERGAEVTAIPVYRWELPEDTGPLKTAIKEVADKRIDVVIFTSSVQFAHALQIAQELDLKDAFLMGLEHASIASIGPIASQTLRENGVRVDIEPSHPRMGFLVKEAAERLQRS